MAIQAVILTLNGTDYTIPFDTVSGKYKKTISAPAQSSYTQPEHVYGMTLKISDVAGNITSIDKSHSTYGAKMKLRVKEKTAPVITVTSPGAGAYLTSNTASFTIDITDTGSGVNTETITAKLDNVALNLTKTAITNGIRCSYTGTVADGAHVLAVNAADHDENAAAKEVRFTVDTVPPTINISSPAANLITNKPSCIVAGTTNDATSGLATVQITLNNTDQGSVTVAADGSFSKTLPLAKGNNTIVIKATDKAGKSSSVTRTVVYDSDAPVITNIELTPNPVGAGELFTITVEAVD